MTFRDSAPRRKEGALAHQARAESGVNDLVLRLFLSLQFQGDNGFLRQGLTCLANVSKEVILAGEGAVGEGFGRKLEPERPGDVCVCGCVGPCSVSTSICERNSSGRRHSAKGVAVGLWAIASNIGGPNPRNEARWGPEEAPHRFEIDGIAEISGAFSFSFSF